MTGRPQEKTKNIKEVIRMWQEKDRKARKAAEEQEQGVPGDARDEEVGGQVHERLDRAEQGGGDDDEVGVFLTVDLGDIPHGVEPDNLTFKNIVKTLPVKRKELDLEEVEDQGTPDRKRRSAPLAVRRRAKSEKSDKYKNNNLITNHFRSLSSAVQAGDVQQAVQELGGTK